MRCVSVPTSDTANTKFSTQGTIHHATVICVLDMDMLIVIVIGIGIRSENNNNNIIICNKLRLCSRTPAPVALTWNHFLNAPAPAQQAQARKAYPPADG